MEKLSFIFKGINSINIPEIAPKIIICNESVLFIANPKNTQNKNPDKEPEIDLSHIFPIGKARPTNPATASPTERNNNANTETSKSNIITEQVNPINIHVAPVKWPFSSFDLRTDLRYL